jgi:cobalamin biosynthetic protein CobC
MTLQNEKEVVHGGKLGLAATMFPNAPLPWIDLSTGINPTSYPLFDLPATALTRLPDPARHRELLAVAASSYGAPSAANVVAAPGTQSLLPLVAGLVKPGSALVLGPTYAEHLRACRLVGHDAGETTDFTKLFDADLVVVVNPNNPDGRVVKRTDLLTLAAAMRRKGGMLVVDEAFMDVGPREESLAGDVEAGGLVVMRSFGKFFGLAGLRLGFALATADVAKPLASRLGPWSVSGPALEYGLAALADSAWQAETRRVLKEQVAALDLTLARHGIVVSCGTDLFRFATGLDASELFSVLGGQGILVRAFDWRPDAVRIGLPKAGEHGRLDQALALWAEKKTQHRPLGLR